MKELTAYFIRYGKSKNVFVALADESIPLKILNSYTDVLDSFVFEDFVKDDQVSFMKKLCKDTGKMILLHRNHHNKSIREFSNAIIGSRVTCKEYSLKSWNDFLSGVSEYSLNIESIIEIDHPIDLNDEILKSIIKEGLFEIEKRRKEMKESIKKIRKEKKKANKKNGK